MYLDGSATEQHDSREIYVRRADVYVVRSMISRARALSSFARRVISRGGERVSDESESYALDSAVCRRASPLSSLPCAMSLIRSTVRQKDRRLVPSISALCSSVPR